MRFEFATATRIVFGAGTLKQAGNLVHELGRRALVVTGRDPNRAEGLLSLLAEKGVVASVFSVAGEPDLTTVEEGVVRARTAEADAVVSFGGGSALDAGKAIAAVLTNPGKLLDYLEVIGRGAPLSHPAAPFLAIPTTAGTGSEVTRNAVLASPSHKVKVSLRSPSMLPRIALVDPELTYGLPPGVTASTGLDALTQLIEPFVSMRANPLTDALCLEGMRHVARSLAVAFRDGQNAGARQDMALASLFGGLALANAGLGAVHGFAGAIGGRFPAPHGAICAALLPHVMSSNLRALEKREPQSQALARYAQAAQVLTGNPGAQAYEGVEWVRRLVRTLCIAPLSVYGLKRDHTAELVEQALKASSMKANPIGLEREELAETLTAAL